MARTNIAIDDDILAEIREYQRRAPEVFGRPTLRSVIRALLALGLAAAAKKRRQARG